MEEDIAGIEGEIGGRGGGGGGGRGGGGGGIACEKQSFCFIQEMITTNTLF